MTGQEDENWYYQQQPTYDEYGRPVHQQPQGYYQQQPHDPYGQQQGYYQQQPQGYYQPQQQQPVYDPYGQPYVQEQYPQEQYHQEQYVHPVAPPVQPVAPPPAPPVAPAPAPPRPRKPEPAAAPAEAAEPSEQVGGSRAARSRAGQDGYTTGEFTFVDEESEESEDVIDWLKFAESRSEVRAERRRRLRNRLVGAAVALAVLAAGGVGYLWFTGKLGGDSAAKAAGGRQVNVVHLRDLQGRTTTALLVDDEGGRKATVLLLPDTLKLPSSGDSTVVSLGQALDPSVGPSATRDGLTTVLGAPVAGTWRLDTPYLQLLVDQLGGVKVSVNADVHEGNQASGKLLASAGKTVNLTGSGAVAYATYQAPTEGRDAQLARFGQVMAAVIQAMPTNLTDATDDVHRMGSVLDPSLPEKALGGVLAQLSKQAAAGHLSTASLTVKADGTLDEATAGPQVKDILGGTVHAARASSATTRVTIVNASGTDGNATAAGVQVTNAGLDLVPSSAKAPAQPASEIRYTSDDKQAVAKSLAASLNLPDSVVKKVTDQQNADLVLVLGRDYQPPPKTP